MMAPPQTRTQHSSYALDAAKLVNKCLQELDSLIHRRSSRTTRNKAPPVVVVTHSTAHQQQDGTSGGKTPLVDMVETLRYTESLLIIHLQEMIMEYDEQEEQEQELDEHELYQYQPPKSINEYYGHTSNDDDDHHHQHNGRNKNATNDGTAGSTTTMTLHDCISKLEEKILLLRRRQEKQQQQQQHPAAKEGQQHAITTATTTTRKVLGHRLQHERDINRNHFLYTAYSKDRSDNKNSSSHHLDYHPRRNATDSLLFRLSIDLNLLLLRIEDVRVVLTKQTRRRPSSSSLPRGDYNRYGQQQHCTKYHEETEAGSDLTCDDSHDEKTDESHTIESTTGVGHSKNYLGSAAAAVTTALVAIGGARVMQSKHRQETSSSSSSNNIVATTGRMIMMMMTMSTSSSTSANNMNEIRGGVGIAMTAIRTLQYFDWSPLLRATAAVLTIGWVGNHCSIWWVSSKIVKSNEAIMDWNRQWELLSSSSCSTRLSTTSALNNSSSSKIIKRSTSPMTTSTKTVISSAQSDYNKKKDFSVCNACHQDAVMDAIQFQKLVEYTLRETPKTSLWLSQGEIRFWMLKRAMDVFYASVGTALEVTNKTTAGRHSDKIFGSSSLDWQVTAISAAVSFFYTITGASRKAAEATSSSSSSSKSSARGLIQNAWGMVSLPAIKSLSLSASKLLKGAAVADRIEICGISCFVLSKDPAPELAAAIQCFHRKQNRLGRRRGRSRCLAPAMSTIDEQNVHHHHNHHDSSFKTNNKVTTTTTTKSTSCTFDEEDASSSSSECDQAHHQNNINKSSFEVAGSGSSLSSLGRYNRKRDVILHLTGGGFFAHIIASDLPYLLDWSASTGAVIICPEYGLLPQHTFPHALVQIEQVYKTLCSLSSSTSSLGYEQDGTDTSQSSLSSSSTTPSTYTTTTSLGFEINRVVITGESAGGNLAAALCVKLSMERLQQERRQNQENNPPSMKKKRPFSSLSASGCRHGGHEDDNDDNQDMSSDETCISKDKVNDGNKELKLENASSALAPLPTALMLSCPVLNLSLEVSHSRVVGTADPVLPSGLISAISDAYIPNHLGIGKKDPLASPLYATDDVLRHFPPTLVFASSNDPLLDDAVIFNRRLRSLDVECDLRAVQNLPHAYLGLGTAGFPEAKQVQDQCQEWLIYQLNREEQ